MKKFIIGLGFTEEKPEFITYKMLSHPWGSCMFAPAAPFPKYIIIFDHVQQTIIGFAVYCQKQEFLVEITGIHLFFGEMPEDIDIALSFGLTANAIVKYFTEKEMSVETHIASVYERDMWDIAIQAGIKINIASEVLNGSAFHKDFLIKFSTLELENSKETIAAELPQSSSDPSFETPESR